MKARVRALSWGRLSTLGTRLALFGAVGLAAVAVVVSIGLAISHEAERLRGEATSTLRADLSVKTAWVEQFSEERLADGMVVQRDAALAASISDLVHARIGDLDRARLHERLELLVEHEQFQYARVLDPQGREVLTVPATDLPLASSVARMAASMGVADRPFLFEVSGSGAGQPLRLATLVPIADPGAQGSVAAVVELSIDPTRELRASVEAPVATYRTAAVALVRRDDAEVLIAGAQSWPASDVAAALTTPTVDGGVSRPSVAPDVMAADGSSVLTVSSQIPGTGWVLLARVATAEALAPLGARLGTGILIVALLTGALGLGTLALWRSHEAARLRDRLVDVSERLALEEARERLAVAVDQTSDAVVVLDDRQVITYTNPAFEAITGYGAREAVGRTPAFLNGPHGTPPGMRGWIGPARDRPWAGTLTLWSRDGRPFEAEWGINPLRDAAGRLVGHVAVARDRTHERELEAQVATSQRLEALGQLAAGVAHDFNNLLTAIGGFGTMARDALAADDPVREDLEQVLTAADRGAVLVRQLLAFGRRQPAAPVVLDLNDVVSGLAPMLQRLLGEDIQVVQRLDPSPCPVRADAGQIEQIIVNLTANARDAMPGGGSLRIETTASTAAHGRRVAPGSVRPGRYATLTVTDTGIGMDAATIEHIFEPFYTTKGDRGTGLGLATVYGIVEQSGGRIEVRSTPGVGTTFTVHLPAALDEAAPAPSEHVGHVPEGTERILLVEDDDGVRTASARILRELGYQVAEAASAEEALSRWEEGPVDLLIADLVLPGLSGMELAVELRTVVRDLPAIVSSGHPDSAIRGLADGKDFVTFLPKPYTAESLGRTARRALDARRASRRSAAARGGPAGTHPARQLEGAADRTASAVRVG